MDAPTSALQTLDAGNFIAEITENGTVRIRATITEEEVRLTARAAYALLHMLHDHRTHLYRCANGESPELPDWIRRDEPRLSPSKPWLPKQPGEEF